MASPFGRPPPVSQAPARRRIPGPWGLPWLGQLPAFLAEKFFPTQLLKWTDEYGGVFTFEIIGKKYVVVTEPSLIPEILGRGSAGFPKSPGYAMWDSAISPHKGIQGLFTVADTNATWRAVRRAYGPAMGPGSLSVHYPIVVDCCERLCARMAEDGRHGASALEVSSLLKRVTLDMLGLSAFGVDFGCVRQQGPAQLAHDIETAMHECGQRGTAAGRRLAPWLFEQQRAEGQAAMDSFYATCEELWQQMKAHGPPAADDESMTAQLLRLADPARGAAALSDEQVRAEIATVVVAGYETTANALTWMLFALWRHADASAMLLQELRTAGAPPSRSYVRTAYVLTQTRQLQTWLVSNHTPKTGFLPHGDDPEAVRAAFSRPGAFERLTSLPYLDGFVRECLRLYTITPNGALKQVPHGRGDGGAMAVGQYEVPEGATVWVPFWSVHRSSRYWEAPLEFKPGAAAAALQGESGSSSAAGVLSSAGPVATAVLEPPPAAAREGGGGGSRSNGDAGDGSSSSDDSSSGSSTSGRSIRNAKAIRFLPFSDGSRNCVGQHLATLQLKVVVAYLACRFSFQLDEGAMGGLEGALGRQRVNLTLEVEDGMWMFAVPK